MLGFMYVHGSLDIMKHLPSHKRPREKLVEKGQENLSLEELFCLLLGSGIKKYPVMRVAKKIIQQCSGNWTSVSIAQLEQIRGLGRAKASLIVSALEIGQRLFSQKDTSKLCIEKTEDLLPLVRDIIVAKQEHLVCFYLNARSEVILQKTVSIGTLTNSLIHPREVFFEAIMQSAYSIILVHNHPSGSLYASEEDVLATKMIARAGELLDIPLQDHIIVTAEGWTRIPGIG